MDDQVSKEKKCSKLEVVATDLDKTTTQQRHKPRKLESKAKNILQQVKQKVAALASWIGRQLSDTTDLAYTQAYTQGFGLAGLELGM